MTAYLSPPTVAENLGVNESKILGWIRSGELQAVNVAARAGGRPRWRISQEALDQFLIVRGASPTPKVTRRRARRDPAVIEFF